MTKVRAVVNMNIWEICSTPKHGPYLPQLKDVQIDFGESELFMDRPVSHLHTFYIMYVTPRRFGSFLEPQGQNIRTIQNDSPRQGMALGRMGISGKQS